MRQHGAPDPVDEDLRSAEVAILPQRGGGFLVLVANRVDGVAVRLPDGTWRRGLPSAQRGLVATPLTSPGDDVLREVVLAVLLGAALLFFALQPKLRRYPRMAAWTSGSALLGIALIDLAALIPWLLNLVAAGVGVLAVLAGAPTWLAMVVGDRGLHAWYVLSALAISLATGFGWRCRSSAGRPGPPTATPRLPASRPPPSPPARPARSCSPSSPGVIPRGRRQYRARPPAWTKPGQRHSAGGPLGYRRGTFANST
jgi:hypothetical protein